MAVPEGSGGLLKAFRSTIVPYQTHLLPCSITFSSLVSVSPYFRSRTTGIWQCPLSLRPHPLACVKGILAFVPPPHITNQFHSRAIQGGDATICDVFWPRQNYRSEKRLHRSQLAAVADDSSDVSYDDLKVGSPIMIIEAPPHLKTAEPMPMMRPNKGAVMPGDAGRIISRKPKDVWAIRFKSGAFLIDRRYFKPLDPGCE